MRRILLIGLSLVVLYSCATAPDAAVEEEQLPSDSVEASQTDAVVAADDDATSADPGPVAALDEPSAAPGDRAPATLTLVNPVDPSKITRSQVLISGIVSDGRLTAFDVEVLAGPVVADPDRFPFEQIDASQLPADLRSARVRAESDTATVTIPPGFEDGARYTIRVRAVLDDGRETGWIDFESELDLRLETPSIAPIAATLDVSPTLSVSDAYEGRAYSVSLFREGAFVSERSGFARELAADGPILPGAYLATARMVTPDGYLTRSGPWIEVEVLGDATPAGVAPTALRTLSPRVGLHWRAPVGATGFEARYRAAGDSAWQGVDPVSTAYVALPDLLEVGRSHEWQVRARNAAGTWFSWSETRRFEVGSLGLSFVSVVAPGDRVSLLRGYAQGGRDERPVREITLSRPFEMGVVPVTNDQLVRIVETAVDLGLVRVEADGVWSIEPEGESALVPQTRTSIVGLGELDYGEQFGLILRDGRLESTPGYGSHPAVGVTWFGAVFVANLLSYVEGLAPALGPLGEATAVASGYRLPTEAEWEYAARGGSASLVPWRGELSGRVANYYRSFDPFEDVNEPFTRAGGPTTPVGFFDGSVREGFRTLNDASVFGVRDMIGNVWEWTLDRYDPGYYESSPELDPTGPDRTVSLQGDPAVVLAVALDPNQRAVRGSAWNSRVPDIRATKRGRYSESGRSYSIGLRLIRSPGE